MILPTMSNDEKAYEAFRMTNWLCDCYRHLKPEIDDKFRRGTRFPYFQRYGMKDDKLNDWTFLFYCKSKDMKKKGLYYTQAYITYDIPRKRMEYDVNAGRGCLIFDPLQMRKRIENRDTCSIIIEIVPHVFNRYTERYLKPLGMENIEFTRKLESMLTRWQWFDIEADLLGDKNALKHKGDNICPYDVMMCDGGMLRGQIVNEMLLRFTTYVSKDMMFDNQHERQQEMASEYFSMKRKKMII